MKNKILSVLVSAVVLCACLFALASCGQDEPPHTHNYATSKYDNESHWFECECGEKNGITAHNIKNGECVCGYIVPHTHDYTELKNNETAHWNECVCGDKESIEAHKGGTATCTELAVCSVCNESYGELEEHNYATLKNNETAHWNECVCGDKESIEAHKGGTATCTELAVCSVCNESYGELEEHNYATLKNNETAHWNECVCGDKESIEAHKGGTATCTELAVCSVCNESYGELEEHNYATLKNNETAHWNECVCGDKESIEAHKGGTATCTELAVCSVCNESYGELEEHNYATLKKNETQHWYECVCGAKNSIEAHKGGTATCTELAVCSVCNESYGELEEHNYATLKKNETQHWYECVCGAKNSIEAHKDGTATCTEFAVCSVCSKEYGELEEHNCNTLKHNETQHWYECICGAIVKEGAHEWGNLVCSGCQISIYDITNINTIRLLYKYIRPDGGLTVSPNKPDCEYTEGYRLVANEGNELYYNGEPRHATILDVDSIYGWTEGPKCEECEHDAENVSEASY